MTADAVTPDGPAPPTPIHAYLAALDRGDLDAAAAVFAEDALYIRPALGNVTASPDPSRGVTGLDVLRGRRAIRACFARRGVLPFHHVVTHYVTDGRTCFVEGVVTDRVPGAGDLFMCSAVCEGDVITRYSSIATVAPLSEIGEIGEIAAAGGSA